MLMVSDPLPFTDSDVPKAKLVVLLLPIRVAFQFPLILAGFEFEPHPTRAKPTTSKIATANCFISESLRVKESEGARAMLDAEKWRAGGFGARWMVRYTYKPTALGIVAVDLCGWIEGL